MEFEDGLLTAGGGKMGGNQEEVETLSGRSDVFVLQD